MNESGAVRLDDDVSEVSGSNVETSAASMQAAPLPRSAEDGPEAPEGWGVALRRGREATGLSLEDVSTQLKITSRRVDALESERLEDLPEGPFLRGLLRNYAKLLGMEAEPLLAQLPSQTSAASSLDLAMPTLQAPMPGAGASEAKRLAPGFLLVFLACLGVFGAGLYFWAGASSIDAGGSILSGATERLFGTAVERGESAAGPMVVSPDSRRDVTEPMAESAAEQYEGMVTHPVEAQIMAGSDGHGVRAAQAELETQAMLSMSQAGTTEIPAAGTASAATQSEARDTVAATPAAGAAKTASGAADSRNLPLVVRFRGESWIEIRQGDDTLLLSGVQPANSERTVTGRPPFRIVIGNAPGVSIMFRGERIDLEPYTRDRVARFDLD